MLSLQAPYYQTEWWNERTSAATAHKINVTEGSVTTIDETLVPSAP